MLEASNFTYVVDEERNVYSNMTVKKRYMDEACTDFSGWSIFANDGYVIYNANATNVEPVVDENGDFVYDENGNIVEQPVIYYYTATHKNPNYNWNNFNYIAVLRSTVDENYIFGVGNNNHEVI